jgi:hypothetical protein
MHIEKLLSDWVVGAGQIRYVLILQKEAVSKESNPYG